MKIEYLLIILVALLVVVCYGLKKKLEKSLEDLNDAVMESETIKRYCSELLAKRNIRTISVKDEDRNIVGYKVLFNNDYYLMLTSNASDQDKVRAKAEIGKDIVEAVLEGKDNVL